ncbi:MAG: CRISPR-associated endonuclease Cas6, partial [candidate division KSB1 bacterium]|nr:CRISPR-associated endonuclease Cas6 [candidate division KSB1 bacterium]
PRVQFKVLDSMALLIGVAEGSALLSRLWLEVDQTTIGTDELPVLEASIRKRHDLLGNTQEAIDYRFVTPWLALNQENARRFWRLHKTIQRVSLLERILVGNCLSLAKSFGYTVREVLRADCSLLEEAPCRLKGVQMLGFTGEFRINFLIPNYFGLGKSVSRGFGTVERVRP